MPVLGEAVVPLPAPLVFAFPPGAEPFDWPNATLARTTNANNVYNFFITVIWDSNTTKKKIEDMTKTSVGSICFKK